MLALARNHSCNHSKHRRCSRSRVGCPAVATPLWGVMTTTCTHARETAHSAVATARTIYEMA